MDPAIAGKGGHNAAFRAACMITAQGLTEDEEWEVWQESFNRRCMPPWSDSETAHKLDQAREYGTNEPLPDRPTLTVVEAPTDETWKQELAFNNKTGNVQPISKNAILILKKDPRWRNRIRLDTFVQDCRLINPDWPAYVRPEKQGEYWTDADTIRLQCWFREHYGVQFGIPVIEAAVKVEQENNRFSSAQDWFDSLVWDGTDRVSNWLTRYLGAEPTEFASTVGRWWLVSAVARVYKPGVKADHVLILHGDQGKGKSSAAAALAGPDWFSDTAIVIGDKDGYLALRGKLIVELAELEALNKAESNSIKSFLSSPTDRYRVPYDRRPIDVPRQCVFIGTTNHDEILKDDTGDRRFWPVTCGEIDVAGIRADREQIWAQAVALYRQGAAWYPRTSHEIQLCEIQQDEYKTVDPWQVRISQDLDLRTVDRTTIEDVLTNIPVPKTQWNQTVKNRVSKCLAQLGWERRNDKGFDGAKRRYYIRP
jgi:putative DNA primase/helicase